MAHINKELKRISDPKVDKIWDVMRQKGWNITKLSKSCNTSYVHLNKVLNGRKPLSL